MNETPTSRTTRFAYACLLFGLLSILFVALTFISDGPVINGAFMTFPLIPVLAGFGFIALFPLTLITALVAVLRITFSRREVRGGKQIGWGIGLAFLGLIIIMTCQ